MRTISTILLVLSWLLPADLSSAKVINEMVYLVTAGPVDKKYADAIRSRLPDALPIAVKIIPSPNEPLPESAYDPARKQYDAQAVVDTIAEKVELYVADEWALVIVDADLYIPGQDFVFGFADTKKKICLVALARLKNEFHGEKPNDTAFRDRSLKLALFELGQIWGVDSCPKPTCVMNASEKLSDIDKKKNRFCIECRDKLLFRYIRPLVKTKLKKIT